MLPTVTHPTHEFTVPSTQQKVSVRPMTGREEKMLLTAKASGDAREELKSMKRAVDACLIDQTTADMAVFDIEYLFLKLRAVSVENIARIGLYDEDDKDLHEFEVDLNKVEIKWPDPVQSKVVTDADGLALELRYPPASLYEDEELATATLERARDLLIAKCLVKVHYGDAVYTDFTETEALEWIDTLPITVLEKVTSFFDNQPTIWHELKYTNKLGAEKTYVLRDLSDFFSLR